MKNYVGKVAELPEEPEEPSLAEDFEAEADTDAQVQVTMKLSAETALQVAFIKGYLQLKTRAEAVKVAVSISALLLNEIKYGSIVYLQGKSGSRSRLTMERRQRK